MQAKQTVCPPDVPQYNPEWIDQREKYLLGRGWERDHATGLPTYRDPKGSKLAGEMRVVGMLPVKGDDLRKEEPLRQMHVSAHSYSFMLEEALDMQRRRDATGDDGPSPLDRLASCEDRCNELSRQLEQFKGRVQAILSTHHITFEGMKLGLRELIGA